MSTFYQLSYFFSPYFSISSLAAPSLKAIVIAVRHAKSHIHISPLPWSILSCSLSWTPCTILGSSALDRLEARKSFRWLVRSLTDLEMSRLCRTFAESRQVEDESFICWHSALPTINQDHCVCAMDDSIPSLVHQAFPLQLAALPNLVYKPMSLSRCSVWVSYTYSRLHPCSSSYCQGKNNATFGLSNH